MKLSITAAAILLIGTSTMTHADDNVQVVQKLPTASSGGLYTANRAPLAPSPLIKLPIGAIKPKGWLLHQLELERDGMTGHLTELSPWCKFEGSAWSDPKGKGANGWEELPYWLKGFGDLGYVLHDKRIIAEARRWIDATLASQQPDGWFGPQSNKSHPEASGHADFWPNMLMLNVLQSYYEYSHDPRVLPFMTKYFRFQLNYKDADFLTSYWAKMRAADNLESVYWLYNRTGEAWLLELAEKIHRHTAAWSTGVIDGHGVNISQGFREPGIYFMQARKQKFLDTAESNYQHFMGEYGQFPGGGFASDETCRAGFGDPRQGCETCSWVELMHSFEMLAKIGGNPLWADRCEERRLQLAAGRDVGQRKGAPLPHRRQHGPVRRQEQVAGHRQRRQHARLQPLELPLLPAQRLARLALLRRRTVARHGRPRALRHDVRRQRRDGQGGTGRRRRGRNRHDHRLSVQRHHCLEADDAQDGAVPALPPHSPVVRAGERRDQRQPRPRRP